MDSTATKSAGMTADQFAFYKARARSMKKAELEFAMADCRAAIDAWSAGDPNDRHPREGFYSDQIAVFGDELRRREARSAARRK